MHDRRQRSRPWTGTSWSYDPDHPGSRWTPWRAGQCVIAVWLLVSPLTFGSGAEAPVLAKDLIAGAVLLVVTVAAVLRRSARTVEDTTCVVLGCVLVAGSFVLDHGRGGGPLTAQWSELAVGVLLICLGAAKAR